MGAAPWRRARALSDSDIEPQREHSRANGVAGDHAVTSFIAAAFAPDRVGMLQGCGTPLHLGG
jgi:hypothetical protein